MQHEGDLTVRAADGPAFIASLYTTLGVSAMVIGFERPTLEDAFIALTGNSTQEERPGNGNHIRDLVRERKLA